MKLHACVLEGVRAGPLRRHAEFIGLVGLDDATRYVGNHPDRAQAVR